MSRQFQVRNLKTTSTKEYWGTPEMKISYEGTDWRVTTPYTNCRYESSLALNRTVWTEIRILFSATKSKKKKKSLSE